MVYQTALNPETSYFILRKDCPRFCFCKEMFQPVPIAFHSEFDEHEIVGFGLCIVSHSVRFFATYI